MTERELLVALVPYVAWEKLPEDLKTEYLALLRQPPAPPAPPPARERTYTAEEAVQVALTKKARITSADVMRESGCAHSTAHHTLSILYGRGVLKRVAQGIYSRADA